MSLTLLSISMRISIILLIVLTLREYISRLHSSTPLRTKHALYQQTSLLPINITVITIPVSLRHILYPIARLMHRHTTKTAEHDHVLILIISIVTNCTLRVLLRRILPLALRVVVRNRRQVLRQRLLLSAAVLLHQSALELQVLQDLPVGEVALALLDLLYVSQEVLLQLGRLAHVQQDLVAVLLEPVSVVEHVLDDEGLHAGQEVQTVAVHAH